ncbi:unnamed protein product [Urochloa humidicola]
MTSSEDPEVVKVVQQFRSVYLEGERATISKCINVVKSSKDRESFIRSFTLLALGSILCPGTGNCVELKYLYSLLDTYQVSSYDWAGVVIEQLMDEIKRYQQFMPERLERDHQMGSCLIILAIAYMDHLLLPSDRGRQINYSLPRISHVSNADFEYVMEVDLNKLSLELSFGKLPFRSFSTTPYAPIAAVPLEPVAAAAPEGLAAAAPEDEAPIVGSLDDWLQQQGPTSNNLEQIPVEFQHVAAQFSNLFKQDVDQYVSALCTGISEHVTSLWNKRNAQMLCRMAELAHAARSDGSSAGASTSGEGAGADGEGGGADEPPTSDGAGAGKCTTSVPGSVPSTTTHTVAASQPPRSSSAAAASGPSTNPPAAAALQVPPSSSATLASQPTTSLAAATATLVKAPTPTTSTSTSYIDDVPSFDLLKLAELDIEAHQIPAVTTGKEDVADVNKSGSSTHEKKTRKKRVACNLNQGERAAKRIKIGMEAKMAYSRYVAKRILKKPKVERDAEGNIIEQPPFVRIAGFHVSYEAFYNSLKPRGQIDNHVMTLYTYLINIEEKEARERDTTIVKKYSFSSVLTEKLKMDPTKFVSDSRTRELARLNNTWQFSKLDLLFFPILDGEHWVLVCVNLFLGQICWFNSIKGTTDTICFQRARNLIKNFSKEALSSGVLKKDISDWKWIYPQNYPYQNTTYDCGLYTMLYMESWNGKKMDVGGFQPHMIDGFRKLIAGDLLLNIRNEIPTWQFVKQNCKKNEH